MKLTLLYVHNEAMGYGRMGVKLAESLEHAGVDIYDGFDTPAEHETGNSRIIERDGARRYHMTDTVAWCSVPTHARGWYEGQQAVILTMWEATRLPESFRENIHNFDTVVVPSEHNVELFSQYHRNVKLCLLGVDPNVWRFQRRKPPTTRFNFLIGGSGGRKGTDLAVKAFRKVFATWPADGPVPYLVMKSPKPEDFYGDRIERVPGRISPEDEVALYADAHVYLQPSRGEGFGLQPLQAIAQGCPTILTDAHGHGSFAQLGIPISARLAQSGYFVYGDAGEWWEPSFDELCEAMLWTYRNYGEACDYAEKNSEVARTDFTWERTADQFLDAIGRDRLGDYRGPGIWRPAAPKLYWTTTNRDWMCEVAGVTYLFHKGERVLAPADVKRILWEGNLLDLSDDDQDGLLPEQAAACAEYQARNAYCPTCLQKLGSGTTKADELLGVT